MITTKDKKRILNTFGVVGEVKVKSAEWKNSIIEPFRAIGKCEKSLTVLIGHNNLIISTSGVQLEVFESGIADGWLRQFIPWKNVTILWCKYPGNSVTNNSTTEATV